MVLKGPNPTVDLTTREGFQFQVRPARESDAADLGEFFSHVSSEDLRFRFLTAVDEVGAARLAELTRTDHDLTESFVAVDKDGRTIIANAVIAASPDLSRAEVALAIRSDYKRRGISWTLLEHIARYARARGIGVLESVESRDNHAAIELEREMGFRAFSDPGDPTILILRADLTELAPE